MLKSLLIACTTALTLLGAAANPQAAAADEVIRFNFNKASSFKEFDAFNGKWDLDSKNYGALLRNREIAATLYDRAFTRFSAEIRISNSPLNGVGGVLVNANVNGDRISGYFVAYENADDENFLRVYRFDRVDAGGFKGKIKLLCDRKVRSQGVKLPKLAVIVRKNDFAGVIVNGGEECAVRDRTYTEGSFGLATAARKGELFTIDELQIRVAK
jgi:hypothetical protein